MSDDKVTVGEWGLDSPASSRLKTTRVIGKSLIIIHLYLTYSFITIYALHSRLIYSRV